MRIWHPALLLIVLTACSKKDETASGPAQGAGDDPPAVNEAARTEAPAKTASKAAASPPDCDEHITPALVAEHCGETPELTANEIMPDDDTSCRRMAKLDGHATLAIHVFRRSAAEWKDITRQFAAEPAVEREDDRLQTRVRAWPHTVWLDQRLRGKAPLCDEAGAPALAAAIAASLPASDTPEPAAFEEDPMCAALLTESDLAELCGSGFAPTPSGMSSELTPCHRVGPGGFVFIVTRHPDAGTASRGAEVAKGGSGVAVGTQGRYLVELKASASAGGKAACTDAQLAELRDRVLGRLEGQ